MQSRKRARPEPTDVTVVEQLHGGPKSGEIGTYVDSYVNGPDYMEIVDFHKKQRPNGKGRYGVTPLRKFRAQVRGSGTGSRTNWPWPGEVVQLLKPGPQLYLRNLGKFTESEGNSVRHLLSLTDAWGSEMSSYATEARLKFEDQIPQQLSIPNFAYEFGEVKDLAKGVLEFAQSFSSKSVAGSYLAWEFGGAPLIGDLENLANLYSTVASRIQHLKDTWGKETNLVHVKRGLNKLPVLRDWIELPISSIGPVGRFDAWPIDHVESVRFFGKLTQRLEGLDTWAGWLRAFAAATGFNNPLGIVWETVPFSFVVDWVSNVSSLFDRFKAQPFQGQWDVYDVGFTQLGVSTFKIRQRDVQNPELDYGDVGMLTLSEQRRWIGFPEQIVNLDFTQMSPKQLMLSIALGRGVVSF